jgi:hypothetical protein
MEIFPSDNGNTAYNTNFITSKNFENDKREETTVSAETVRASKYQVDRPPTL